MIQPTGEELALRYRAMLDEQLLEIALSYDALTQTAQAAIRNEFAARSLEPPELPESPHHDEEQKWVTIGRYRDLPQAQIAKSVLESAGIPALLRDENTIRLEWVWSNLLGGIRLQVAVQDSESAQAILAQPIPEAISVSDFPDYVQPRCPRCSSLHIRYESKDQKLGVASMLLLGFPVAFSKNAWSCDDCLAQWQETAESKPDAAG